MERYTTPTTANQTNTTSEAPLPLYKEREVWLTPSMPDGSSKYWMRDVVNALPCSSTVQIVRKSGKMSLYMDGSVLPGFDEFTEVAHYGFSENGTVVFDQGGSALNVGGLNVLSFAVSHGIGLNISMAEQGYTSLRKSWYIGGAEIKAAEELKGRNWYIAKKLRRNVFWRTNVLKQTIRKNWRKLSGMSKTFEHLPP